MKKAIALTEIGVFRRCIEIHRLPLRFDPPYHKLTMFQKAAQDPFDAQIGADGSLIRQTIGQTQGALGRY